MSVILAPFQLLELNVISAQDLAPVTRSMRTYAVAWVHPDRKLSTRVDTHSHVNPTWNDKFVFRVNEEFLYEDTSAIMIEIYALHWFKDIHVGTIRVLVDNLVAPPSRSFQNHHTPMGMRFVALQVRRPSGRPQGILNIGVAVLDSSMRSMPLYKHNSSAVGYRHLMGEKDAYDSHNHMMSPQLFGASKPQLRRTKSDTSSMISSNAIARQKRSSAKNVKKASSVLSYTSEVSKTKRRSKGSSMVNGSEVSSWVSKNKSKNGKASSVLSESELQLKVNGKTSPILSGSDVKDTPDRGKFDKPYSIVKGSEVVQTPDRKIIVSVKDNDHKTPKKNDIFNGTDSLISSVEGTSMTDMTEKFDAEQIQTIYPRTNNMYEVKASPRLQYRNSPVGSKFNPPVGFGGSHKGTPKTTPLHAFGKLNGHFEYNTPRRSNMGNMVAPVMTESELGPSPSEVAAAMAKQSRIEEVENSTVDGWSMDESVEGLQSKLERWKTELPPVYDCGEFSSLPASTANKTSHGRRHTDGGNGLFSCFSNICGLQCTIVCGGDDAKKKVVRRRRTPSVDSSSFP